MTVVVGTAGHIDHGKTSLLRALTGIDADRLPEEQARGMTIDVGYAHLTLPDGRELDFVDVPGHDKLVGNMLVGAGEIDAALLVVAADDGPRAQTLEHLELLDGLGIDAGIAVVTKTDVVDENRTVTVIEEVRRLLDRTGLRGAPVFAASAVTGVGLDAVRSALHGLASSVSARTPTGPARLAIDRVFSVRGRGAVATGSLKGSGGLARGMALRLEPGGSSVRIREVQVHGRAVERAEGGGRTALNLAGAEAGALRRGAFLTTGPGVEVTDRMLVALWPVAPLRRADPGLPGDRSRVRLHVGTDQVDATVGRAGREAVDLDGGGATAILRLARPVAVGIGDRFVLRRSSAASTEAGGRVLDPHPPRGAARRRISPERLAALASSPGLETLVAIHGLLPRVRAQHVFGATDQDSSRTALDLVAPDVLEALAARALATVAGSARLADVRRVLAVEAKRATAGGDDAAAVIGFVLDELTTSGRLERHGDTLRDPRFVPTGPTEEVVAAMDRLVTILEIEAPPPLAGAARVAGCPDGAIRDLERNGRIVRLEPDLAYGAVTYARLEARAVELAGAAPLTPAALRDATGTSRKYVMAILEDLDRRAILRRTPEGHVPGPRSHRSDPVGTAPS